MSTESKSKILVTGGAGFVGRHTCEKLLRDGKHVILVDALNSETSSKEEKEENIAFLKRVSQAATGSKLSVYTCNLLDQPKLNQILDQAKPTGCIHAAALVMDRRSVYTAKEFITQNVLGTQCLLDAIAETGTVKHLVYISSRSAVGEVPTPDALMTEELLPRPINPYGASKVAAEAFCHSFHKLTDIAVSICRMQPMYGPKGRPDMMPRRLLEKIHAGIEIEKYGSGEAVRDWLYITDAVDGILATLWNPMGIEIFNFGTGVGTTVNELISVAEVVVGRPAVVVNVDVPPGDAHFGGVCDITKAKRLLKWEPQVDLKTGLTRTFEYMLREQGGEQQRRNTSFVIRNTSGREEKRFSST